MRDCSDYAVACRAVDGDEAAKDELERRGVSAVDALCW